MEAPQTNLLEYIGTEETNLLVSMNLCKADMDMFPKIDGLFQAPIKKINLKVKDKKNLTDDERLRMTVLTLYLYVHHHMYSAFTSMLRCHLSDALSQTRKGIDASLTAARLIKEPGTLNQYLERHADYRNVKRFVADTNKKDSNQYPDTDPLIKMHEICSQFGSHADVSSFIHRVEMTEEDELGQSLLKLHMFQKPDSDLEFRYYVVQIFLTYIQMLRLFKDYVGDLAIDLNKSDWITAMDQVGGAIYKEAQKLEEQIAKASGSAA